MTVTDIRLVDAVEDYYATKHGEYAESSWRAHSRNIDDMRKWLVKETQPDVYLSDLVAYGERYMERYFNRLRPPRYAPASFNHFRKIATGFWRYCRAEGWIAVDPMRNVGPLPVPRKVRLRLSAEELLALLDDASERDRVALAIGMNTALRANDITALKVGSVNLTNDTLAVYQQKTKTEALLPITAELREELVRWFEHYAKAMDVTPATLPNEWTLVPSANWWPDYPGAKTGRTVYATNSTLPNPARVVKRALERHNHATYREGFHTLRRSVAREVYNLAADDGVGDPIRIAQSLLGHKNRLTTELYLGVTHEDKLRDDMMRGKSILNRAAAARAAEHQPQFERKLKSA